VYSFETIVLEFKVTEVRLEQPLKTYLPIAVKLLGIIIDVRLEQSEKAQSPMLVTSLPMIYSVTCSPKIFFILSDIEYDLETNLLEFKVTEVRLEQPLKA
jgi:hypothetical protein